MVSNNNEQISGVTRRQALVGAGVSAAALAALGRLNGASAQTPAAATGELTVPSTTLSSEGILAILTSALAKATEIGVPSVVSILDASGVQQAFFHQRNALYLSYELAPLKAFSALAFRAPTADVAANFGQLDDPTLVPSLLAVPKVTLVGGGIPITVGDEIIGAIGVSGGTVEQDIEVAQAGIAALG